MTFQLYHRINISGHDAWYNQPLIHHIPNIDSIHSPNYAQNENDIKDNITILLLHIPNIKKYSMIHWNFEQMQNQMFLDA